LQKIINFLAAAGVAPGYNQPGPAARIRPDRALYGVSGRVAVFGDDKYYLVIRIVLGEQAPEVLFDAGIDAFNGSNDRGGRRQAAKGFPTGLSNIAFESYSTQQ
jgi:hypothetical protein